MKPYMILCILLTVFTVAVNAQDSTKTLGSQGDPALRESSDVLREMNLRNMTKITDAELPAPVKKTLEREEYKATEKTFYKNKTKDEYGVEIRDGEITRFFVFDKKGKLVTNRQ